MVIVGTQRKLSLTFASVSINMVFDKYVSRQRDRESKKKKARLLENWNFILNSQVCIKIVKNI